MMCNASVMLKLDMITSSAGSATLGDTSGAKQHTKKNNLWLHLASWNFSTLLRIQDRAKCGKGTELHCGGGHCTEKFVLEGGHRTCLLDEWNKWGGDTAQH